MINPIPGFSPFFSRQNAHQKGLWNWTLSATDAEVASELMAQKWDFLNQLKNGPRDPLKIKLMITKLINALKLIDTSPGATKNTVESTILSVISFMNLFLFQELKKTTFHFDMNPLQNTINDLFSFCVKTENLKSAEIMYSWGNLESPFVFLYSLKAFLYSLLVQQSAIYTDPDFTFSNGDSPLHVAIKSGFARGVTLLLKRGYNPNLLTTENKTILEYLMESDLVCGRESILDALDDGNYNFNKPDCKGNTIFHYSAIYGLPSIILWGQNRGIPVNQQNNQGQTALFIAIFNGFFKRTDATHKIPEVISLLVQQGSLPNIGTNDCYEMLSQATAFTLQEKEKILEQLLKTRCLTRCLEMLQYIPLLLPFEYPADIENLQIQNIREGFKTDPEDTSDPVFGHIGEVQGSQMLRQKVCLLNPSIFSLDSILLFKKVNHQLYTAFLIKRFAHALCLGNTFLSVRKQKISYEGFSESFTLPMLASTIRLLKPQKNLSKEDLDWIFNQLKIAQIADRLVTSRDYEILSERLQRPNYQNAIVCGCGYDWHFPAWIVYGDFFIYCNRGAREDNDEREIVIYFLPEKMRKKMTPPVLEAIINRYQSTKSNYFTLQSMEKTFHLELIFQMHMKQHTAGICTYATSKVLIYVLMAIRYFMINYPGKILICDANRFWSQAFRYHHPSYKMFTQTDRYLVVSHLLYETDKFLKNPNEESLADAKIYYKLLLSAVASFTLPGILEPTIQIKRLEYKYRIILLDRLVKIYPYIQHTLS